MQAAAKGWLTTILLLSSRDGGGVEKNWSLGGAKGAAAAETMNHTHAAGGGEAPAAQNQYFYTRRVRTREYARRTHVACRALGVGRNGRRYYPRGLRPESSARCPSELENAPPAPRNRRRRAASDARCTRRPLRAWGEGWWWWCWAWRWHWAGGGRGGNADTTKRTPAAGSLPFNLWTGGFYLRRARVNTGPAVGRSPPPHHE